MVCKRMYWKAFYLLDNKAGGLTFALLEPAHDTEDATDVMDKTDIDHI